MLVKYEVEDACKPCLNQIAVEVEFASAPKFEVGVHAKGAPPPPEPQALPVLDISPCAENWAHPADAAEVTTKLVLVPVPDIVSPPV